MCYVYIVVGLWRQHDETSVTSASVTSSAPLDSLSDVAPVTTLSNSDVALHSVASPQQLVDNKLAVS